MILAKDGALAILVSSAGILRGVQGETTPENVQVWENLNRASAHIFTSNFIFCNRVGVEDGLMFWGGSEVLDPHGKQVAKSPYFEEDLLLAEVDFLKLKNARLHTTLLNDERIDIVTEELQRIARANREY